MKPVITNSDYNILKTAMLHLPPAHKTKEVPQLIEELRRGSIVNDDEITADVIRLNSYFEAEDLNTQKIMKFMLTLPANANFQEHKISVLSPLGIALIGFKEGMTIDCALPAGNKKMRILKVKNPIKA